MIVNVLLVEKFDYNWKNFILVFILILGGNRF